MSKIICDVCGTSYPETATQCPICGCVRSVDARIVAGNTDDAETEVTRSYSHVKGGRFSKSNVKKRNHGKPVASVEEPAKTPESQQDDNKKETGIIITTLVVLLIILAVVVYIVVSFFLPNLLPEKPAENAGVNENTSSETGTTTDTTILQIPCDEILLSKTVITFESADAVVLLNVTVLPNESTDIVTFASSDESVATVTQDGKVTSVGAGEAVITVTCGAAKAECKVVCSVEDPEVETTESETVSPSELKLNREDFTLNSKGETWKLYSGEIAANQITWTSDNENVVTVKDGVVTAVGSGMTTVHGEYGGAKVSCIVRCSAAMGKAETSTTETTAPKADCTISSEDVTVKAGENFVLTLKDADGNEVKVTWTASDSSICKVSGNTVTGVAKGNATVKTTYNGVVYTCIVRVTN